MIEVPVSAEFVANANPEQLHAEARGSRDEWPASFVEQPDGSWLYRVERDDVDVAEVQAAIGAHEPQFAPDPDDELQAAIEAATSLEDLKAALLGTGGAARAAARRPDHANGR